MHKTQSDTIPCRTPDHSFWKHVMVTLVITAAALGLAATCAMAEESLENISEMDLLDEETALQVGDRLAYSVIEEREPEILLRVNEKGEVDFPLIGKVKVAGSTCKEIATEVKKQLEVNFFHQATVLLAHRFRTQAQMEVSIIGQVRQQGSFALPDDGEMTASKAIIQAGGFLPGADTTRVSVIRKNPDNPDEETTFIVDSGTILETGDFDSDQLLQAGDLILVPKREQAGGQFYITGAVNAPGLFDIPDEVDFTVSKAILRAGGFTRFANKKKVKLIRADTSIPENERTVFVNVADILERGQRDFDPLIKPDDIIRVEERMIVF